MTEINTIEDIPNITIYKFRDWQNANHRKILQGELFFSSSTNFNDPFDCKIPIRYDLLEKDDSLKELYLNNYNFNESEKNQISESLKIPKIVEEVTNKHLIDSENSFGIISFTKKYKNILLWSHYANSHTGFVIGFNLRKLFEYIKSILGIENLAIADVQYYPKPNEEYPLILPYYKNIMEQYFIRFYSKSKEWKYEEEFRFTSQDNVNKKIHVDSSIIEDIILGCNMNQFDKDIIISYRDKYLTHTNVLAAVKEKNSFELNFEQIR